MAKLKKCTVNKKEATKKLRNQQHKVDLQEKDNLIKIISQQSDRYGDKLIHFMDLNQINSLSEATVEQLRAYVMRYCNQVQKNDVKIF